MQRLYHKPGPGAPLEACPADELEERRARGGWVWLDVRGADPAEVHEVGALFGFDPLTLEDTIDHVTFPKVDDYADYLFIVLHGLSAADTRLSTSELDAFLGSDFLVTFHREDLAGMEWMAENATRHAALSDGGPDDFLARLAEIGSRRYLPLLDGLEQRTEELEDRAVAADPTVIPELQALRRDVILLRRVLGPQREALADLGREGNPIISERGRRRFAGVYDHYFRLVESLEAARLLLAAVLDTYRGAVAERMNDVMKVLTVFAAIILPLSLLAGVYGMNFTNMPELRWRWGYFAVLGIMAVTAIGLWLYFSHRGFVGGPRLRKLPKVVGLGLVHLAAAPIRTVGWLLFEDEGREGPR